MSKAANTGGRNKSLVTHLFKPTSQLSKMERVKCSFCHKNGTRVTRQIEMCQKCPDKVKRLYVKNVDKKDAAKISGHWQK